MKKSDWQNSVFLTNIEGIKKLKKSEGLDLKIWGSSKLVQLLLKHDLVDEFWLNIHPIILGKGKKLFDDGAVPVAFKLVEGHVLPSGVIMANYKRAGEVKTGTVGA
jgi:dihydrofolate reductase